MEEQKEKKQGHKSKGQKYKSLLVWDIFQKRTDENHDKKERISPLYSFWYDANAKKLLVIYLFCTIFKLF